MKSYTDIEQSKALAKILPLESADMVWILANPDLPMIKAIAYEDSEKSKYYEVLPAWSLAALIGVLPDDTDIVKGQSDDTDGKYMCTVGYKNDILSTFSDNPIDACVAMVEKLHKLNLL